LIFGQGGLPPPESDHPAAAALPQICTGGWYPRHEELA